MWDDTQYQAGDSTAMRVVEAVARTKDVDPISLEPPLASAVDPDALDALTASAAPGFSLRFTYADCHVEVDSDGHVDVDHSPTLAD